MCQSFFDSLWEAWAKRTVTPSLFRGRRVPNTVRERENFIVVDFVDGMDEIEWLMKIREDRRYLVFTMKDQVDRFKYSESLSSMTLEIVS